MSPHAGVEGPPATGSEDLSATPGRLATLAVLIPAWQPDEQLPALVAALLAAGFGHAVVVDDGSDAHAAPIFAELSTRERVTVLRHRENRGKGRALKTGFEHLLATQPAGAGVVTADADGQHRPEDIAHVGEVLLRAEGRSVLGVRLFSGEVPLRSRVGNIVARRLFASVTGTSLADTQTGLRGLPLGLLPELLPLPGERYEYEMTMLAQLCAGAARPVEVPIATVYLQHNRGSHFHPVRDSLQVYGALWAARRRGNPR